MGNINGGREVVKDADAVPAAPGRDDARRVENGGQTPVSSSPEERAVRKPGPLARALLVIAGFACVGLGVAGIFLPLLPATPFFLLAGLCFAKGSDRFDRWLRNRKWFQTYAARYADGRGVPPHVKALTILILWAGIAVSALFMLTGLIPRCGLILVGVAVTIHIMLIRPRKKDSSGTVVAVPPAPDESV